MAEGAELLGPAARDRLRPAVDAGWRPPMLATLADRPFSDPNWVFERKLDGVRALVCRDGGAPHLWSRSHKPMDAGYPELVDALADRAPDRFVADGEIVAFDGARTSFTTLQRRIHLTDPAEIAAAGVPVFLYLFDLLVIGAVDLTLLPLRDRKRLLRRAFDFGGPLRLSAHRNGEGEAYYRQACERGWEGLIAKRASAPYRGGRSADWLKLKSVRRQDFVVGGFTEPNGTRVGFGALLVGHRDGGRLRYAGRVGTGYDVPTLLALRARLDGLRAADSPFDGPVDVPRPHWVRPDLVADVGFAEWTPDGRLRHPRFIRLR